MTRWFAEVCTDYMIQADALPKSKRAVLLYGMEVLIATVIGVVSIAIISFLFGEPWAWLFFLLAFVPLRRTAGGYHADTHLVCYIVFAASFAICLGIEKSGIVSEMAFVVMMAISLGLVLLYSPCVPNNKQLDKRKQKHNRLFSVIIGVSAFVIALLLHLNQLDLFVVHYFYYGVLSASISLLAAKIKTRIQKGERENERESS